MWLTLQCSLLSELTQRSLCGLNIFGDTAAMTEAKLGADGLTAAMFTNTDIHCANLLWLVDTALNLTTNGVMVLPASSLIGR